MGLGKTPIYLSNVLFSFLQISLAARGHMVQPAFQTTDLTSLVVSHVEFFSTQDRLPSFIHVQGRDYLHAYARAGPHLNILAKHCRDVQQQNLSKKKHQMML